MRIATIIGKLTLTQCHPSLKGATWVIGVPLNLEGIAKADSGGTAGRGEPFVIYDDLGAGTGSTIAVSEGAEAAAPFYPDNKPIDAYNAAVLDSLELHPPAK